MQLGNIIKKYRKEKNLTQEEMANYLGVTAPAVNKWESGASCPDIALLSPIARLLGISTDTLLSFKEDLSRVEIGQLANGVAEKLQAEGLEAGYAETMSILREYPNCDLLTLTVAQILDSYRIIGYAADYEKYEGKIVTLFERVLVSQDMNVRHGAIVALFNKCLEKEEYEKAQDYLTRIEKQLTNPERYQALLYERQGKTEEAYEGYERLIFTGFSEVLWALNGLYSLEIKEKDFKRAEQIVEKQEQLAKTLEMGKYSEVSPRMILALAKKDKEEWFETMKKMIDHLGDSTAFQNSDLYRHIKIAKETNFSMAAQMIRKGLERDKELDFLRDDPRFEKLMEKLADL